MFLVGRLRDPVPVQPVAHPVDLVAGGAARAVARRRARPAAAGRLRQGRARRLPRRHPGARPERGAPARLRRVHPRRAPPRRLVVPLEPAARRRSARRTTSAWCATSSSAWGEAGGDLAGQAGEGRPQPLRRAATRRRRGPRTGVGPRGRAAARGRSRGARGRPGGRRRRPRHRRGGPGGATGTPSSSGCSPRPAPTATGVVDVPLPSQPVGDRRSPGCATTPDAFARELARPMPRQPSPAARFGTRFHAWVEARFGQQDLLDPDDLPGRGDAGIDDEDDLAELIADASSAGRSPTGSRTRSRRRSRWCSPGRWCAAASTRSTDGARRRAGWSSTGRPTRVRTPTRSSSRSTGWPGPTLDAAYAARATSARPGVYYVRVTGRLVELGYRTFCGSARSSRDREGGMFGTTG